MPEEFPVAKVFRVEPISLTMPLNLKAINKGDIPTTGSSLNVLVNHLVGLLVHFKLFDVASELGVVLIEWILPLFLFLLVIWECFMVHDVHSHVNVKQVLDQLQLLLDFLRVINDEVHKFSHAKVVWDIRVELT